MLAKVFQVDVTQCQHCQGEMSIVAAIIKRTSLCKRLLTALANAYKIN